MSGDRREKRNFALVDKKGEEVGTFSGSKPRDAALKAARRGNMEIVLREKGTKKLHYFRGDRVLVKAPKEAPQWIQDAARKQDGKIYKAEVRKIGTAVLKSPRLADNDRNLFRVPGSEAGAMNGKKRRSGYDFCESPAVSAKKAYSDDMLSHGTPTTTHDHRHKPLKKTGGKPTPPKR